MKTKQFCAEIRAAGCYIIRRGGNHDIWYSPITGRRWPIGRHESQEMPSGTERKAREVLGVQ